MVLFALEILKGTVQQADRSILHVFLGSDLGIIESSMSAIVKLFIEGLHSVCTASGEFRSRLKILVHRGGATNLHDLQEDAQIVDVTDRPIRETVVKGELALGIRT
jgi:hypothetical protein